MPYFTCSICGNSVSYSAEDREKYESHFWECDLCFRLICTRRYKVNIPGAVTCFSPMGDGFGDNIVQLVVKEQYEIDNPDENVVFLESIDDAKQYNIDKFFWANMYAGGTMLMPDDALWFSLCNEVNGFAGQDKYSKWPGRKRVQGFDRGCNYAVLHLRDIDKNNSEWKNVEPAYIFRILALLYYDFICKGLLDKIVILGNDRIGDLSVKMFETVFNKILPIGDFRNGLNSLDEIAWIMENARILIGKDSGIAHLFGAVLCAKPGGWVTEQGYNQSMVVWGYQQDRWFPKVPQDRFDAWVIKDSKIETICERIKTRLL